MVDNRRYYTVILKMTGLDETSSVQIQEFAQNVCNCQGIEEYVLEEAEIDQLLGNRAFSVGEVSSDILCNVEDFQKRRGVVFKFYYYGDRATEDALAFTEHLKNYFPTIDFSFEDNLWANWNENWKEHYRPVVIADDLIILPEWYDRHQYKEYKHQVIINPGMGFGTGGHETTNLCLKLLSEIGPCAGDCLDLGCGSGILGIAAIKLFNLSVDFCDIDRAALDNCLYNLKLNFLGQRLSGHSLVARERLSCDKKYNLILANILEHVLIEEVEFIINSLNQNGLLIISGILQGQVDNLLLDQKYNTLNLLKMVSKGEWSALLLSRTR